MENKKRNKNSIENSKEGYDDYMDITLIALAFFLLLAVLYIS